MAFIGITGAAGSGGGAASNVTIQDGASATKATIFALTNSNPIAARLVDANGNGISGIGGGPVTVADGADVCEGATTDVAVVGDVAGTVSAKLRGLNKILNDVWDSANHWFKVSIQNATLAVTQSGSWVLAAGSALIGKVGIDQTTPGTTNNVNVDTATGAGATTGVTTGTAVVTDANGTLQQYLRGLVKLIAGTLTVSVNAATSGGWTPYNYISAGSANQDSQVIKNSGGQLGYISAFSTVAALRVLKIYDKATSPTSADTPVYSAPLPNNTTGSGSNLGIPAGVVFSSGISFRITSGVANSDTGAAAANDVVVNCGYK